MQIPNYVHLFDTYLQVSKGEPFTNIIHITVTVQISNGGTFPLRTNWLWCEVDTYFHLVPRLKMHGPVPPLMAQCLLRHRIHLHGMVLN